MHPPKLGLRIIYYPHPGIYFSDKSNLLFYYKMRLQLFVLAAASSSLFSCLFFVYPFKNKNRKRNQKKKKREKGENKKLCVPCFLNGDKCSYFFFHLDDWLLMPPCKVKFSYWNCLDMIKAKRTINQYKFERILLNCHQF